MACLSEELATMLSTQDVDYAAKSVILSLAPVLGYVSRMADGPASHLNVLVSLAFTTTFPPLKPWEF